MIAASAEHVCRVNGRSVLASASADKTIKIWYGAHRRLASARAHAHACSGLIALLRPCRGASARSKATRDQAVLSRLRCVARTCRLQGHDDRILRAHARSPQGQGAGPPPPLLQPPAPHTQPPRPRPVRRLGSPGGVPGGVSSATRRVAVWRAGAGARVAPARAVGAALRYSKPGCPIGPDPTAPPPAPLKLPRAIQSPSSTMHGVAHGPPAMSPPSPGTHSGRRRYAACCLWYRCLILAAGGFDGQVAVVDVRAPGVARCVASAPRGLPVSTVGTSAGRMAS